LTYVAEKNESKKHGAPVDPSRSAAAVAVEPPPESLGTRAGTAFLRFLLEPFAELGMLARMFWETLFWAVRPPYRFRLFIDSMEFVGIGSVFIVTLTGFFVGAVLGLQLADGFRRFNAESQTGAVVGIALSREIGPVFASLMVASRAGSAITAQLGSMRVSNQIDALVTMSVNPVQYLVVPRVLAGLLMVPLLDLLFVVVGMFGAWLVCVHLLGIDGGVFLDRMRSIVGWKDVRQGLLKAAVFGTTVCLISCRQGFHASGGAAGVGQATNRAVVHCAIAILALDYIVTSIILGKGLF
jgi:phospholipid/cholesterol/gamma-HCH transport system permease protein